MAWPSSHGPDTRVPAVCNTQDAPRCIEYQAAQTRMLVGCAKHATRMTGGLRKAQADPHQPGLLKSHRGRIMPFKRHPFRSHSVPRCPSSFNSLLHKPPLKYLCTPAVFLMMKQSSTQTRYPLACLHPFITVPMSKVHRQSLLLELNKIRTTHLKMIIRHSFTASSHAYLIVFKTNTNNYRQAITAQLNPKI